MLSIAQVALNNSDIVETVLSYLVNDSLDQLQERSRSSTLTSLSTISRGWFEPTQKLLFDQVTLERGDQQLEEFLYNIQRRNYLTSQLVLWDKYPFKEGGKWSYDMVGKVLESVKGLKILMLEFCGQVDLSPKWMTLKSLKDLFSLHLSSPFAPSKASEIPSFNLHHLRIDDTYLKLDRNWKHTCSLFSRTRRDRSLGLNVLELLNLTENFVSLLVPSFPLAPDLNDSSQGSLIRLTPELRILHLPTLLPGPHSHNIALFGASASFLHSLSFDSLTPKSYISVPLLRFFPNLARLTIEKFIALPLAGYLLDSQIQQLAKQGKGDSMAAIVSLIEKGQLPKLQSITIETWKFLRHDQIQLLCLKLQESKVRLQVLSYDSILWTQADLNEYQKLQSEIVIAHQHDIQELQARQAAEVDKEIEEIRAVIAELSGEEAASDHDGSDTLEEGETLDGDETLLVVDGNQDINKEEEENGEKEAKKEEQKS
ncbi:hypothetical protein JCM5350_004503 [Sporobolomyces pararoseus]